MKKFPECLWWIGGVVASGIVLLGAIEAGVPHIPPNTPFEATRSGHAAQWAFLREASAHVPPGATFTIHAVDTDTEMSLFMMAVGLLPRATAIPRTYYGKAVAPSESARFVLAFGDAAGDCRGTGRAIAVAGGTVTDRGSLHP